MKKFYERDNEAWEIGTTRVNAASERRANTFNAERLQADNGRGDLVLLWLPPKLLAINGSKHWSGLTTKLLHTWYEPFEIHEKLSGQSCSIRPRRGRKKTPSVLYVRRLKSYHDQIADEEITATPDEDDDELMYDKTKGDTFEDERLDSIALHEWKRATARYK